MEIATVDDIKIKKVSPDDVRSVFKVLHNMGMVLHFDAILPDKVFPKPQLLLDLLYQKILNKSQKDKITVAQISKSIDNNELNLSLEEVIELLLYFDLIFTIPTEKDTYFIPQYLKPPPALIDFFEKHQFSFVNLKILGDNYLMSIIMLKLFSKFGKDVKGKETKEYLFWKDGLVIEKDNMILMLKFNREEQFIAFYTDSGLSNQRLQFEVLEFILNIPYQNKKFEKAEGHELTSDGKIKKQARENSVKQDKKYNFENELNFESEYLSICLSTDGEYFVKWEELHSHLKNGIFSVLIKNRENKEKKVSVFNFNNYLPNANKGGMKKMFISYSKDDLALVNSYIKSLQPMLLEGSLSDVWYCSYLSPGDETHEKIKEKMEQADIICFIASNNFYATKYIVENELKPTLKRKADGGKQLILPIVADRCKWTSDNKEINLGKFAGFPYRGKPVSDFDNWNDAWYVMNWYLEQVIKNNSQPEETYDFSLNLPSDISDLLERQIGKELDKNKP